MAFERFGTLGDLLRMEPRHGLARDVIQLAPGSGTMALGTLLSRRTSDGLWVASLKTGPDGVDQPRAVLLQDVTLDSSPMQAVALRFGVAEVNFARLVFDPSVASVSSRWLLCDRLFANTGIRVNGQREGFEPDAPAGSPAVIVDPGTISGTRGNGNTILGTEATAEGDAPITITYSWATWDGATLTTIPDETGINIVDQTAWQAFSLIRIATATNAFGSDSRQSNELTPDVPEFAFSVLPTVSGDYGEGEIVTITPAVTVNGVAPVSIVYQGQSRIGAVWSDIPGATGLSWTRTLALADAGIRWRATATDAASNVIVGYSNEIPENFVYTSPSATTAPSFIQEDGDGGWEAAEPILGDRRVYLDAGVWTGGVPPYSFEFAIHDADDDSVIIARTDEFEFELPTTLEGRTVYGRVWCVDQNLTEGVADTADFGPLTLGFVSEVVLSIPHRDTLSYVTDTFSEDTPIAAADGWAYPIVRNGRDVGWYNSQPTASNRSTSFGSRLAGSVNFNTSGRRVRYDVPNGNYTLFLGARTTSTYTGRLWIYDGDPDTDGILITTIDGISSTDGSGNVRDATNTVRTPSAWNSLAPDSCGAGLPITITKGSLRLRRDPSQTGSELFPLAFLRLRTRAP